MSLGHIRTWVFDLDNTLYPAPALYDAIGVRMTAYIARALSLTEDAALEIRESLFHQHGATVVGLMRDHGVDAHDFIADVHAVDYSVLTPDPELASLIAALPGRKIIFTNGSEAHAANVLKHLHCEVFDDVFAIETAEFAPKPQRASYERLIAAHGLDARASVLFEDTMRNLEPAHELGFATVLFGDVHPDPLPAYVDHWTRDLKNFLRGALTR
jgi:putative hydrolase of the HAD superfamily